MNNDRLLSWTVLCGVIALCEKSSIVLTKNKYTQCSKNSVTCIICLVIWNKLQRYVKMFISVCLFYSL